MVAPDSERSVRGHITMHHPLRVRETAAWSDAQALQSMAPLQTVKLGIDEPWQKDRTLFYRN